MGRSSFARQPRSVETTNASTILSTKLSALTPDKDALREYVLKDYLLLYALVGGAVYLLAIRHQRQLSFDFAGHWGRKYTRTVVAILAKRADTQRLP